MAHGQTGFFCSLHNTELKFDVTNEKKLYCESCLEIFRKIQEYVAKMKDSTTCPKKNRKGIRCGQPVNHYGLCQNGTLAPADTYEIQTLPERK